VLEPLPDVLTSASYQLLAQARRLSTGNATDRQIATVFALSACESYTEQALTKLIRRRAAALNGIIVALLGTTINLGNSRVQTIYGWLTDDYPWGDARLKRPQAPWWTDWSASRDLRNDVAHAGQPVTPVEAARCVKSGVSYLAHVTDAVARALA
jgi:hypothetical protein